MGRKKDYISSTNRRDIGLDRPGYDDQKLCEIPEWRGYRSTTAQLLGDPPIGRSALDRRETRHG
jgi:hypothetical protein